MQALAYIFDAVQWSLVYIGVFDIIKVDRFGDDVVKKSSIYISPGYAWLDHDQLIYTEFGQQKMPNFREGFEVIMPILILSFESINLLISYRFIKWRY